MHSKGTKPSGAGHSRVRRDRGCSAPPHQQQSQAGIIALRDPQLRVPFAGIALPRDEPEVGGDLPVTVEARRILDREHEGERGERPHAGDLPEGGRLEMGLAERLDLSVG